MIFIQAVCYRNEGFIPAGVSGFVAADQQDGISLSDRRHTERGKDAPVLMRNSLMWE